MKNIIPQTISVLIILVIVSAGFAKEQNYFRQEADIQTEKFTAPSIDLLQSHEAYNNVTLDDEKGKLKHHHRRR
ncbi:MAG: hypothetical protein KTR22_00115 [Flavobacteriaceae bacterium]|nr:hypothetical protein [Flavobacteriaceae bacterium]